MAEEKKQGKTVGLITGCFDILHIDHTTLFRSAKQHVDVLVIGVERDESLKSKNPNRPFNTLTWRCEMLSELTSVDLVFPIEFVIEYKTSEVNNKMYEALYKRIRPDFLITSPIADEYWKEKRQRAQNMGLGFLGLEMEKRISSTDIINKLQGEI